jgi:hypothetical protein
MLPADSVTNISIGDLIVQSYTDDLNLNNQKIVSDAMDYLLNLMGFMIMRLENIPILQSFTSSIEP